MTPEKTDETTDNSKQTKEEPKTPPETKKEDDKGISEEEVLRRIEAVRKQEKDKLYDTIAGLKETVDSLNAAAQAEQEAKTKVEADAKAKADAKRQAELSTEDRMSEKMKQFEEQLAKAESARLNLEKELSAEREAAELEKYRQQVLSGAEDIIPDLVGGTSKEDIDRSIAFAKSRYQELFQLTKSKAEGNITNNMPGPTDPNPAALDEAELQKSIANFTIDPKRYMKDSKYKAEMDEKRNAVLERVGSAYERANRR